MGFTSLPRQVTGFVTSTHAEVVAVLGAYKRNQQLTLGFAGEQLIYDVQEGNSWDPSGSTGMPVWAWSAATPGKPEKRKGRLFAVRDDGLVVTEGDEEFITWRGTKRLRTIKSPDFGIMSASGAIVHDRLCLPAKAGLVIIDLDLGKPVRTLVERNENDDDERVLEFAAAPDRGIAVHDGAAITIYDLDSGKARKTIKGPRDVEMRALAISPDGAWGVAATVSKKKWTVGSTGFIAINLKSGKAQPLAGHKPYTRNPVFVDGGRLLATTSTDRTIRLWQTGTWKLVEKINLASASDDPSSLHAWDAHGALVLVGERGVAYVFRVSAEPESLTSDRAAAPAKGKRR